MICKTCDNFRGVDYDEGLGIVVLCAVLGGVKAKREATCQHERHEDYQPPTEVPNHG